MRVFEFAGWKIEQKFSNNWPEKEYYMHTMNIFPEKVPSHFIGLEKFQSS